MPDPTVDILQANLAKATADLTAAQDSLKLVTGDKTTAETKLAEAQKALTEKEAKLAEIQLGATKIATVAYLDDLVRRGKIVPAMRKAGLDDLMIQLSESDIVIKLSEGDNKTECSAIDTLKHILEAVPVSTSRFMEQTDLSAGGILETTPDNADLAAAIDHYRREQKCTENEAVDAVSKMAATSGRRLTR